MWANSNWDDPRAEREKAIRDIEQRFDEAIARVYSETGKLPEEELDLREDPFFAAGEKGLPQLGR